MSKALMRIVVPLTLLMLLVAVSEAEDLLPPKVYVHEEIFNDLSGNKDLILHCYERKGGDLGEQKLHTGERFSFTFRPDFWGTTKYYCSFTWDGIDSLKWFDLFVDERDYDVCRTCSWVLVENGVICRFDTHNPQVYYGCIPLKDN